MIFQREKPFRVFGNCSEDGRVEVKLDGKSLGVYPVEKGAFCLELPPQRAKWNSTLEVGSVLLENVDFGEVWIAGGQSNMQFYVKWDSDRERVYERPSDPHFRYYDVARWAFEGEEKDGLRERDAAHWDKWNSFSRETSPYFSSLPTFFALGLRDALGVPVGIVGCNNGGTSASCWIPEEDLAGDAALKVYLDEYRRATEGMDLKRYEILNYFLRADACEEALDLCLSGAPTPQEVAAVRYEHKSSQWIALMRRLREVFTPEEFAQIGPRSRNRPCSLWGTMVEKIAGFTFRGALWYQGCDDRKKGNIHEKLLSTLIARWRKTFCDMPFIVTQLAPFSGNAGQGEGFPEVRAAQARVAEKMPGVFLVSSSDVGNRYDIHPKFKRKLGERSLLQALDKVYGIPTLSDAPVAAGAVRTAEGVAIAMKHAEGLNADGEGGLSALAVFADGEKADFEAEIVGETICLKGEKIARAKKVRIEFAQTPYYLVGLRNRANIPAVPFCAEI